MSRLVPGLLACGFTLAVAFGAEETAAPSNGPAAALEEIRGDLRELRFERALSAIEAFLAAPDLPVGATVEALALRAQARVATGALERAVEDWDRILALRPSFAPDAEAFPRKALARFETLRSAKVGSVRFEIVPADARLLVDGTDASPAEDGLVWLLAGDHPVSVEREGFDPAELTLAVVAGESREVSLQLVPNARTVVIATEPAGVEVRSEDRTFGETSRAGAPGSPADGSAARLILENLPLGEYVFELSKPCYRSTRIRVVVTADLRDPWPMKLETVHLTQARARLTVTGGPEGAELRIDDEPRGRLPLEAVEVCAGRRRVEVHARGRSVWRDDIDVPEIGAVEARVQPRPNACLVGDGPWPAAVGDLVGGLGPCGGPVGPAVGDMDRREAWERTGLPRDTDLAFAAVPSTTAGLAPRIVLFSPLLGTVDELPATWVPPERPTWTRARTGMRLADSETFGPALVVDVASPGPAASAGLSVGDRITSIGDTAVTGSRDVESAFAAVDPGTSVEVGIASADGRARKAAIATEPAPRLIERTVSAGHAALMAAWASVDAAASKDRSAPLTNLAAALSRAGRTEAAVEVGTRARSIEGAGAWRGAAAYTLARDLLALGREGEARELFRVAREAGGSLWDDGGPDLAAAASDHLADFGGADR